MKRLLSLLLISIMAFSFTGCGGAESKKEEKPKEQPKQVTNDKKNQPKEEIKKEEPKKESTGAKRENIIGKSEKNFEDLTKSSPNKVRNDVTGNWRKSTIPTQCQIEEYALSYFKKNFKNKDEIHAIVNFGNNTTTRISDVGDFIEVVVKEYVKGEEHDAKKLFGGMKLKQYFVYKDNGDIQEIK